MRLAVELYGERLGVLSGDARAYDFEPARSAIERFGAGSTILSVGVPLVERPRRDHAGRRRAWFEGLMPEGDQLDYLRAAAGLRAGDHLGFLARYGRDIAGAVQIWDLDDPTEPQEPGLIARDDAGVRALLDDPMKAPLANEPFIGKTSLAGVQPKIALVRTGDDAAAGSGATWAQATGGYPTTHILKPELASRPTLIADEEYGLRIARRLGLLAFSSSLTDFDGRTALVIERFDRDEHGGRLHQEDFSQVIGVTGNGKYQRFGDGQANLRRLASVLRTEATGADVRALARRTILSVAIGDLDAHAKNHGLLHPINGSVRLAPAYDVVPQAHQSIDGEVALAIAKQYRFASLTREMLVAKIGGWGLRGAEGLVARTLDEIHALVLEETPADGAHDALQDDLLRFTKNLVEGRAVGSEG